MPLSACYCRTSAQHAAPQGLKMEKEGQKKEEQPNEKGSQKLCSVLERSWRSNAAIPFQFHSSFEGPAPLAAMQHLFLFCLLPFWTVSLFQGHPMGDILQNKDNLRWCPPYCQPPCAAHHTDTPISRLQRQINKSDIILPSRTVPPSSTPPVSWQPATCPSICQPFPKVDTTVASTLPLPRAQDPVQWGSLRKYFCHQTLN